MANVKYLSYDGLQYLVNKIKIHAIAERITYNDLVTKRNNGELQFGKYYMITDYVTVVNNTEQYISIEEGFAIIVLATSECTLSEEAFAYDNSNEDGYFRVNNANLNAWKLWYCLDNDTNRFGWASVDGKGVIYRMIDEHGNDCPYDFKNIMFRRFKLVFPATPSTARTYLIKLYNNIANRFKNNRLSYIWAGTYTDAINGNHYWESNTSVYSTISADNLFFTFSYIVSIASNDIKDLSITGINCKNNVIKEYYIGNTLQLNNIVFFNTLADSDCYNNSFDINCHSNSFGDDCNTNSFGKNAYNNIFGNTCSSNSFGNGCHFNSFGDRCSTNTFGNSCFNNSADINRYDNTFGNYCYYNVFGKNTYYNIFGNYCYYNMFADSCSSNIFGNNCVGNSLSNNCQYNSFGNDCDYNSFGEYCQSNSFGNGCDYNSFGEYCQSNSFGNGCDYNSFSLADNTSAKIRAYCYYNHFDDGCSYNVIWNNASANSSNKLQNIHIQRGVKGTYSAYNMINIQSLNNEYCTTVAKTSSNELLIYCEEDCLSNDEIDTIF